MERVSFLITVGQKNYKSRWKKSANKIRKYLQNTLEYIYQKNLKNIGQIKRRPRRLLYQFLYGVLKLRLIIGP